MYEWYLKMFRLYHWIYLNKGALKQVFEYYLLIYKLLALRFLLSIIYLSDKSNFSQYISNWKDNFSQFQFMRVEIQSLQDNLMRDCRANNVIIYSLIFKFSVMGWQNRLKFSGKTNRLKVSLIFTILASFVCFFNFPDRNLIILYKITWKLPFRVR